MLTAKIAAQKLKETNWLYKNVDDKSVDEAAKQVIEVISNTSSTMVEKASANIVAFQAYNQKLRQQAFKWIWLSSTSF